MWKILYFNKKVLVCFKLDVVFKFVPGILKCLDAWWMSLFAFLFSTVNLYSYIFIYIYIRVLDQINSERLIWPNILKKKEREREKGPSKVLGTQSYNAFIFDYHEQGRFPGFLTTTLPFYLLSSNALVCNASKNVFPSSDLVNPKQGLSMYLFRVH